MKKLILCIFLLFAHGCSQFISEKSIDEYCKHCEPNLGMSKITIIFASYFYDCLCNNDWQFTLIPHEDRR